MNLEDVEFTVTGNTSSIEIGGDDYYADAVVPRQFAIRGLTKGTVNIVGTYNGTVLHTWCVTVTSDWADYVSYYNWKKGVESEIWTSSMSTVEKLDAAKNYIRTNFTYGSGNTRIYSYITMTADCIDASDMFGDMAKDLGLEVRYCNAYTGLSYKYLIAAYSAADGHIYNQVYVNGSWVTYDAQPPAI